MCPYAHVYGSGFFRVCQVCRPRAQTPGLILSPGSKCIAEPGFDGFLAQESIFCKLREEMKPLVSEF